MPSSKPYQQQGNGVNLLVRLKPRSSRQRIIGVEQGRLLVAVNAPAIAGKANKALIELIASAISVPKSSCRIIRGDSSRLKTVRIDGITGDELADALAASGTVI